MHQKLKEKKPFRIDVIIIGGLIGAAGWICASFFMAQVAKDELAKTFAELFLEFCKTVFVAAFVAFILDRYLKGIFDEGKASRIGQSGISDIYPTRREAADDILPCLQDATHIEIMGISLQDFLLTNRTFSKIWDAIEERLRREEREGVPKEKRLKVRLLMLHPKSSEGRFRYAFEESVYGGQIAALNHDVRLGLEIVQRVWAMIWREGRGDNASLDSKGLEHVTQFLDVKLYHHCPFSLLFLTNKHVFVEQYYYKNHARHVEMPMLRYSKKELQDEFRTSFDVIWKRAKPGILKDCEVGTAEAIERCAIRNIFSKEQRNYSGERQAEALKNCDKNTQIKILSISGKFYRSRMIQELLDATDPKKAGVTVQVLLLNPISSQAILRAVADDYPARIRQELTAWTWMKHCNTNLYKDTEQTVYELQKRMESKFRFQVRLHHGSPACSLFLTKNEAFIEQYIYGRSKRKMDDEVLGAEYPLFEFGRKDGNHDEDTAEMQMLTSTFDVIWKSFSIDVSEYLALDKEREFDLTMEDLSRWNRIHSDAVPEHASV